MMKSMKKATVIFGMIHDELDFIWNWVLPFSTCLCKVVRANLLSIHLTECCYWARVCGLGRETLYLRRLAHQSPCTHRGYTSIQVSWVSYPNLPAGLGMRLGISPKVMTHHITLTYLYSQRHRVWLQWLSLLSHWTVQTMLSIWDSELPWLARVSSSLVPITITQW